MTKIKFLLYSSLILITEISVAAIISYTGDFDVIYNPTNVTLGTIESDITISSFEENQNIFIDTSFNLDLGDNVQQGSYIDSHYLFFDPLSNTENVVSGMGTITFSGDIIGIIYTTSSLNSTDSLLGLTSTIYPSDFIYRGAGGYTTSSYIYGNSDIFSWSDNILSVDRFGTLAGNMDSIRVITESVSVPEPSTFVLLFMGIIGIALFKHTKKSPV